MPLVTTRDMLNRALNHKYAVGQFNINSLEFIQAFLQAAEEEQSPVILGATEAAVEYIGGLNSIVAIIHSLMEEYEITVPVAVHLDHSTSYDKCLEAMRAGFTSVMIDGSHLTLNQNIELTKRVVDFAKPLGVSVEAELGCISGEEDGVVVDECESRIAIPEECHQFVLETGVTCLAPAIGSVHGAYKGEPNLQFHLIEKIVKQTNVPLALHGGTGIPQGDIKRAISLGIAKINVNTENQMLFAAVARRILTKEPSLYDLRKYLGSARESIKHSAQVKMRELGSSGKAS